MSQHEGPHEQFSQKDPHVIEQRESCVAEVIESSSVTRGATVSTGILQGPKHARAKMPGSCGKLWLCWLKLKAKILALVCPCFWFGTRHSCTVCTSSFWQLPVGHVTGFSSRKARRFQPQWHLQERTDSCWSQSLPICDLPSPPEVSLSNLSSSRGDTLSLGSQKATNLQHNSYNTHSQILFQPRSSSSVRSHRDRRNALGTTCFQLNEPRGKSRVYRLSQPAPFQSAKQYHSTYNELWSKSMNLCGFVSLCLSVLWIYVNSRKDSVGFGLIWHWTSGFYMSQPMLQSCNLLTWTTSPGSASRMT